MIARRFFLAVAAAAALSASPSAPYRPAPRGRVRDAETSSFFSCGRRVTRRFPGLPSSRRSGTHTSRSTRLQLRLRRGRRRGMGHRRKAPSGITRGGFFTACANYGDEVTKGTVAGPRVTITKETAVKCILPGSPVTDVVLRQGGVADLYVHTGARLVAQAHVTNTSTTLTVPKGRCTLTAIPRPCSRTRRKRSRTSPT